MASATPTSNTPSGLSSPRSSDPAQTSPTQRAPPISPMRMSEQTSTVIAPPAHRPRMCACVLLDFSWSGDPYGSSMNRSALAPRKRWRWRWRGRKIWIGASIQCQRASHSASPATAAIARPAPCRRRPSALLQQWCLLGVVGAGARPPAFISVDLLCRRADRPHDSVYRAKPRWQCTAPQFSRLLPVTLHMNGGSRINFAVSSNHACLPSRRLFWPTSPQALSRSTGTPPHRSPAPANAP